MDLVQNRCFFGSLQTRAFVASWKPPLGFRASSQPFLGPGASSEPFVWLLGLFRASGPLPFRGFWSFWALLFLLSLFWASGLFWAFCGLLGLLPAFSGPRGRFWAFSRRAHLAFSKASGLFWACCGFLGPWAFSKASGLFCAFCGFLNLFPAFSEPRGFFWAGPFPAFSGPQGLLRLFCAFCLGLFPAFCGPRRPLLGLF